MFFQTFLISVLGERWVSFTSRPLYPRGNSPHPLGIEFYSNWYLVLVFIRAYNKNRFGAQMPPLCTACSSCTSSNNTFRFYRRNVTFPESPKFCRNAAEQMQNSTNPIYPNCSTCPSAAFPNFNFNHVSLFTFQRSSLPPTCFARRTSGYCLRTLTAVISVMFYLCRKCIVFIFIIEGKMENLILWRFPGTKHILIFIKY